MYDYMKTILSAVKVWVIDKLNTNKSDWNQNDENALNYIKNRTHYIKDGINETVYLQQQTVTVGNEYPYFQLSETILFEPGETYTVTFDGKKYECVSYILYGIPVVGNGEFEEDPGGNNEPFLIVGGYSLLYSSSGTHTLSISKIKPNIHYLDPNYIENMYYESGFENELILLDNFNFTVDIYGAYYFDYSPFILSSGYRYQIIFDGVEFNLTCCDSGDGYLLLGNKNRFNNSLNASNEPFVIIGSSTDPDITIFTYGSSTHTITLKQITKKITTVDKKFLPPFAGEKITGKIVKDQDGYNTVADLGAEIFNNYLRNVALGSYSHAEGNETSAYGDASHAEGRQTIASGYCSHAEGIYSTASAHSSHAEGYSTASGDYSHAEGERTTASGDGSHSEGQQTIASGYGSHAEGCDTTASAFGSHAEGYNTIASGEGQHVQGRYNIEDTTLAYIVGNGSSNINRSNAHTLDWDGNAWFAGNVSVGSSQDILATREYVESKILDVPIPEPTDIIKTQKTDNMTQLVGIDENGLIYASNIFNGIILKDAVNNYDYIGEMQNGNFVTYCKTTSIRIDGMPALRQYFNEPFNPEGLTIIATAQDGSEREITNYSYNNLSNSTNNNLIQGVNNIEIIYNEMGVSHKLLIEVLGFDEVEFLLIDFDYAANGDGTYTITDWKGTLNGAPSTKIVIPDSDKIKVNMEG